MSKVKEGNYITIQSFMVTDLGLKGNELLVYAIIYGFSQNDQEFNGSLQYLADWTNSTKQGILKCLKSLQDKNLISKKESYVNNVKVCSYKTIDTAEKSNPEVLNKVEQGIQQSLTGYTTKFNTPIKQSLTNNIDNNIKDNIVNNSTQILAPKTISNRKTKKEKYLDNVIAISEEYNFNDSVLDLIVKFFDDKIQKGKYEGDNYIRGQFSQLAKLSTKKQMESISKSILNGWNSMYYAPDNKYNRGNTFVDTASGKDNIMTTEEIAQYHKDLEARGIEKKYF